MCLDRGAASRAHHMTSTNIYANKATESGKYYFENIGKYQNISDNIKGPPYDFQQHICKGSKIMWKISNISLLVEKQNENGFVIKERKSGEYGTCAWLGYQLPLSSNNTLAAIHGAV